VRKLRFISIAIFLTLILGLKTAEAQSRADMASYDVELRKNFPLLINQVCGVSLTSDCVSQSSEIQIYLRNLCASVQADQRTGCLALASNLANEIIQRKNLPSSSRSTIKSESIEVAEIEARRQAEIVRDQQSKSLRSQLEIQNKQKDIEDSKELCKRILNNDDALKYFKKISELVNLMDYTGKNFLNIKLPGYSDEKFRNWLINSPEIIGNQSSKIKELSLKINTAIESCAYENNNIFYTFLNDNNSASNIVKAIKSSNFNNLKLTIKITDLIENKKISSDLIAVVFSFALTGGSDFYAIHKDELNQKIDDEIRLLNAKKDLIKSNEAESLNKVALEKSINEIAKREGFMGFILDLFSAILILLSAFVIYGPSLLLKIKGLFK
jgi:hypothetical protein